MRQTKTKTKTAMKKKTPTKNQKSRALQYFRSDSQRKGTDRLAILFGSKRITALILLLVLGSAFAGLAILQQSRDSKAAVGNAIPVTCTKTITSGNPGTTMNGMSSGQTLCLSGTFNMGASTITSNGVTISSAPGTQAKILGQFNINGDNNKFLNMYIDGQGKNSGTFLVYNGADNNLIQANDITSTAPDKSSTSFEQRQGICMNIGPGGSNSSLGPKGTTIDRNRIFRCGWGKYDQAIYLSATYGARVTNNYIYDTPMFAMQMYPDSDYAIVENNVFDNSAAGVTFSGEGGKAADYNIFRNNIISNTGRNPYGMGYKAAGSEASLNTWWGTKGTGNQAIDNCIYNGVRGAYKSDFSLVTLSGNILDKDPMYVDPANKDFTLRAGSPCAGKGPLLAGGTQPSPPPTPTPTPTPTTDTTAPSVSISSPASGATVSGTTSLTATASDNIGVSGVQFKINGNNTGAEDTSAPYSTSWNTASVANGTYSITAVARDASGNTKTSTAVSVTVNNQSTTPTPTPTPTTDTTAPSVTMTNPSSGAKLSGTTTLSASASDNVGVAGVKFLVNGSQVGNEDTSSPYSISWNTASVADGSYSITAVARDKSGNTKTSLAVSASIANTVSTPTPTPTPTPSPTTGTSLLTVEAENSTSCVIKKAFTYYCSQGVWTWSSSGANGGKFVALTNTGDSVTQRFNVDSAGNYRLGYIMRSQSYRGDAQVDVYLDGTKIASGVSLSSSAFTYKYIERQLTSGSHTLKVTFTNDKWGNLIPYERGSGTNDRNAYVDQFRLIKL